MTYFFLYVFFGKISCYAHWRGEVEGGMGIWGGSFLNKYYPETSYLFGTLRASSSGRNHMSTDMAIRKGVT